MGEVGRDNAETKPRQNRDKTQSKIRAAEAAVHSEPWICPASICRLSITPATRSCTRTPLFREFPVWAPLPQTLIYIGVWGRGAQTGNSLKRGVCVCTSAWPVCGEAADARWANPGLRVYCCSCSCPDLGLGFVSVLSRFCLGFANSLSPNGWRYRYLYMHIDMYT